MKIKHGQTIAYDKVGNLCCEGCYMLGLKDGKKEAIEEEIKFLKMIQDTYEIKNIFFKKDFEDRIKKLQEIQSNPETKGEKHGN